MKKIRKTIPRDDIVGVINRTIQHCSTVAEREAVCAVAHSVLLNWDGAYHGFKYVDENGDNVPHEIIGNGESYDASRRWYF